jgi:type IV pilus assembly protein PilA
MKKQKGFSLIELLIVVAIILIIAAIAIPNLIRSKMAANEASAVASLRSINTAEVTYANTYQTFTSLANLGGAASACATGTSSTQACLIDSLLAGGTKSGYTFKVTGPTAAVYTTSGTPVTTGSTGTNIFCSDQSLVLYSDKASGTCTVGTNPL